MVSGRLSKEIDEGLISLFVGIAFPDGAIADYVVLTTSPSRWLPLRANDPLRIIDITGAIGSSDWRTEKDRADWIEARIRRAGWSQANILFEHQIGTTKRRTADLVVLDSEGNPAIVVELKSRNSNSSIADGISQVSDLANACGAQFGILSDGISFHTVNHATGMRNESLDFPSPAELGIPSETVADSLDQRESSGSIIHCDSFLAISDVLERWKSSVVIVDHTIPWGIRREFDWGPLNSQLPESIANRRIDIQAAVVGLVASLQATMRLVAILQPKFMFARDYESFRSFLQDRLTVGGILDLPNDTFAPNLHISSSVVALGYQQWKQPDEVVFSSLTNRADLIDIKQRPVITDFLSGLLGNPMKTGFQTKLIREQPWLPGLHDPKVGLIQNRLERVFDAVSLSETCEVFQGVSYSRDEVGTGTPIIRGRDLSSSEVTIDQLSKFKLGKTRVPDRAKVREGDILIQQIGNRPKSYLVDDRLDGAIASNTVIIVRPRDERTNSALLNQFFRSVDGQLLLSRSVGGSAAPTMNLTALRSIPVPILTSEESQNLLEGIAITERIEMELNTYSQKIAASRLAVFSAESKSDLNERVSGMVREARTLETSLSQSSSIDFQIRNFYPYPLAYSYRTLGSRNVPQDLYPEQLRVAENILAFLSSVTLALVNSSDRSAFNGSPVEWWRGGMQPGTWQTIAQGGAGILKGYQSNPLALFFGSLWRRGAKSSDFAKNIRNLVEYKNDFKHDRGPEGEEEFIKNNFEVAEMLEQVMMPLAFLTEHPIRMVRDIDVVRGTRRAMLQTLVYTGDHPGLPQERIEYHEPLTKNDLYIQIVDDQWESLFPFITAKMCPQCKNIETYFIDHWGGTSDSATLKSFERGHTETSEEVSQALLDW